VSELARSMEKLLDATGSVWQLRMQAEEELRVAHEHLAAMTRSYGQAQQENERLRMALQDILDIQEIKNNTGVRLIAELALHSQRR
jgi:uncharacterized membrane protein